LIGALRSTGEWSEDIILIACGMDDATYKLFRSKGVIVYDNEFFTPNWAKLLNNGIFRKEIICAYDKVLYTDQDITIYGKIDELFEQDGDFLSDDDSKTLRNEFIGELKADEGYNLDSPAFCCGVMRYDTAKIPETIIDDLESLRVQYAYINGFMEKKTEWIDQSILNLYFSEKWSQLERESFILKKKPDTILCHCTSFYAPWNWLGGLGTHLKSEYENGISYFNEAL
jgi:lipopolysaccharide biosynthesis glycosyltransferase